MPLAEVEDFSCWICRQVSLSLLEADGIRRPEGETAGSRILVTPRTGMVMLRTLAFTPVKRPVLKPDPAPAYERSGNERNKGKYPMIPSAPDTSRASRGMFTSTNAALKCTPGAAYTIAIGAPHHH